MSAGRDGIFLGGIGSDVFGEHNTARNLQVDNVNDFLRNKYMGEYINWQRTNNGFYESFEGDLHW